MRLVLRELTHPLRPNARRSDRRVASELGIITIVFGLWSETSASRSLCQPCYHLLDYDRMNSSISGRE
jgi:hypothetical protein